MSEQIDPDVTLLEASVEDPAFMPDAILAGAMAHYASLLGVRSGRALEPLVESFGVDAVGMGASVQLAEKPRLALIDFDDRHERRSRRVAVDVRTRIKVFGDETMFGSWGR